MKFIASAHYVTYAALTVLLFGYIAGCQKPPIKPPTAAVKPVFNTYHGVKVEDDYQWLENSEDSAVQAWANEENAYARRVLDGISCREPIAKRLEQLFKQSHPNYYGFSYVGGKFFAIKNQPPNDQPMFVVMDSPMNPGSERVIIDPNRIDPSGKTAMDFYVVSPDARLVAVSLSHGGTEDGDVHVYRVADGTALADVVPRVNGPTAGGDVAWLPDGSGFYYTHYPREGERPAEDMRFYQQIYFHKLGATTDADVYVLGKEFPRIAEVDFETSPDGHAILAVVANGDGGEFEHFLRWRTGKWVQLTRFEDKITSAAFGPDHSLYLLSTADAPRRKILQLRPGKTRLSRARTIVPASDRVITGFVPTEHFLYVADLLGGPSLLRRVNLSDGKQQDLSLPEVSSVSALTPLGNDKLLYRVSTYVEPSAAYMYDPVSNQAERTPLAGASIADFSNVEVKREFARSKDGTMVPMTVLRPKGIKLDGNNQTVLYGYGGYGLSMRPGFNENLSLWLNSGGVYVIANIRGGGEYGEEWHLQGNLTKKQNVFDDFVACAQHLIDTGYTNPKRLAIRGGSNGGLLMGATMTQHPELFKAVVCQKGVLDMLRVELHPNGAFNVTEFGTVKDPEQFKALYAYSPYHHIKEGVKYPDALFTADDNDWRVSPANSRKMVARLQAVTGPESLILLRTSKGQGHGIGSSMSDRIAQEADVWAFLFDRLGVDCSRLRKEMATK